MRYSPLAALALALAATPAIAADLGGNCCADLEERIAELETTTARKGNRKVSVTVYGQVNRALLWYDGPNGSQTELGMDNPLSPSRFGFMGQGKIGDVSAGYMLEIGAVDSGISLRESFLWLENAKLGRVILGHTGVASYNIAAINLANTDAIAQNLKLGPYTGAISDAFGLPFVIDDLPFNTSTRTNVIKYVSPTLAGFILSASYSEDASYSAALRYAGEFEAFKLAAGIGYTHMEDGSETTAGSASVMHIPSGIYLTGAYGEFKNGVWNMLPVDKATMWQMQGGIEQSLNGLGKTTLYGEYGQLDATGLTDKPEIYGIGMVQAIDAAAMDLYIGYRHLSVANGSGDDVDMVMGGMRIKF